MLENQHVGINRHTDGQDDTRYTGQGQSCIQKIQKRQQHNRIRHQGNVGDKAGQTIEQQHEDKHRANTYGKGKDGFILGVLPQSRAYRTGFDNVDLYRQSTTAEHYGKVLRFFERLLSRDFGTASQDGLTDIRCRQHFAIEQNGYRAAYIFRGEVGKLLRTFIGKFQIDDILTVLLISRSLRVLQIGTGKHGIAFFVLKFQHSRLADGLNRRIGVFNTRQFDNHPAFPFPLNNRLGKAQRVDALFHNRDDTVHRIIIYFGNICIFGFQYHMGTALQIKPLPNGERQRLYKGQENANNGHDTDNQFHEIILSQEFSSPFVFCFLYSLMKLTTLSRTSAALYLSV